MSHPAAKSHFDRSIDALTQVFGFLESCYQQMDIGESVQYAVNLSVEELFTNIVKYSPDTGNAVEVALVREPGRVTIRIVDEDTEKFDVTRPSEFDPEMGLEDRREGGVGLHLVQSMMDEINYDYKNRTARITLVKYVEESDV